MSKSCKRWRMVSVCVSSLLKKKSILLVFDSSSPLLSSPLLSAPSLLSNYSQNTPRQCYARTMSIFSRLDMSKSSKRWRRASVSSLSLSCPKIGERWRYGSPVGPTKRTFEKVMAGDERVGPERNMKNSGDGRAWILCALENCYFDVSMSLTLRLLRFLRLSEESRRRRRVILALPSAGKLRNVTMNDSTLSTFPTLHTKIRSKTFAWPLVCLLFSKITTWTDG
jgi:hypothetical protein